MAGAGRPPTTLLRPTLQVVDGGPSPAMTRKNVCLAPFDSVISRQVLEVLTEATNRLEGPACLSHVMAGAGPPSTTCSAGTKKDVDGMPAPAMTTSSGPAGL